MHKLPADRLLAVFKQMISAAMLIKTKGYIHTDISSKSWRYFPDKLPASLPSLHLSQPGSGPLKNFYTDSASGQVKLSGFQHAVVLAKAGKCRGIRRAAYAMPK
jgi:hypothetical protein